MYFHGLLIYLFLQCRLAFTQDLCGGVFHASNGTITSPSFPQHYPNNRNCVWEIIAPPQYRITLNFTHFDLEGNNPHCSYDSVKIYSKMPSDVLRRHGVFCGSTLPPLIISEGNSLRIEFRSDVSNHKTGFAAVFFTVPSAPENVQVLGVTSTTVDVQWDYPFLVNGILRSFVLNLEETDRFESDKCCEIYPLIEIPVKEELEHYLTRITGVKPASTYELSLSAKTVRLGPSQTLTVRTRPPQIPATQPNVTTNLLHDGWRWLNNSDSSEPYSYETYSPLIIEPMLLLVVANDTAVNETGITDDALNKELKSVIPGNFYLAHEYTDESSDINIGDGTVVDGTWGKVRNIPLKIKTDYQLAAVRVTYYKGIYNLAVTLTTVFAIP